MNNTLTRLVQFLVRKPLVLAILLLSVTIFIFNGIRKLSITEDIFAALPKGKLFQQFNSLIETKNISNQVLFSIAANGENDPDLHQQLIDEAAALLDSTCKNYLTDIIATRPDIQQDVYDYYYTNFPAFIDSAYYTHIDSGIVADRIKKSVNESYERMLSPAGLFAKEFLINDPLNITSPFFKQLNETANSNHIVLEDGIVYTAGKKSMLINARLAFSTKESEKNIALSKILQSLEQKWNEKYPHNHLSHFGTFEIAAQNAIQIKKDTTLTIALSLILILLILVLFYRKLSIPLLFVTPGIFGGFLALGVMGYLRPEISAISLATGAIVLGIILDYSFHFFTHLQHTRSLNTTICEISLPLLTGSTTTVLALVALNFTSSVILRDFGLFASVALAGSALFTMIGLPVLIRITRFNYKSFSPQQIHTNLTTFSPRASRWILISIFSVTVFFLFHSFNVKFNSDVESLSIHSGDLIQKENELTGLNPVSEKKLYILAIDSNAETASECNYKAYLELIRLSSSKKVNNIVSAANFDIPQAVVSQNLSRWNNYWALHRNTVIEQLDTDAEKAGFATNAFTRFEQLLHTDSVNLNKSDMLSKTGLSNLVSTENGKTTYITTFNVQVAYKDSVKQMLKNIPGITIFDRSETASILLESVNSDFNFLLFVTAGIVFFTLLIIYGRIELTLLAYFPMIITWIWILGISSVASIEFNFVNIVIATFIFGLGDDFSIFVTDGLLSRYKYNKDSLSSYQSAIILSALTVIIGTGVLFFAQHPAIHSVAAISVIGIICILIISFTLQPILFNLFVQNRIAKNRTPIPFFQLCMSVFCFTYFISGCLLFYPVLLVISLIPLPVAGKRKFVNYIISKFAASVLYSGIHVRKRFYNMKELDFSRPSIIIANHSSFLDILLMLMLNPKVIIMVKDWVYKSPLFGFAVRYVGYIYSDTGTDENISALKSKMDEGYSIMIFPEGSRSDDATIHRFHRGAFYLAEKLHADIQPVLIHGASEVSPKKEMLVKEGSLNVKALPRIKADDVSWGEDYRSRQKSISAYFKKEHALFKDQMEDAEYLWRKVYYNYIFKGPIVEWYGRVKWSLEKKNYDFYNRQIEGRLNICDLGCGYGYFDYFLHYKNADRKITAVDYDAEKIDIAVNGYNKSGNVLFEHADVSEYPIPSSDVIFLNDVLHYLTPEKQQRLLEKCVAALAPDGIIFIRDGITNDSKHVFTKLTEFLSTRIFKFNKKTNDLSFFSSDTISTFATKFNLKVENHSHSQSTSNMLFILRK